MINGVMIRDLVTHADEHGYLFEILREDWPEYQRFGQAYLTVTYPGIVKGWHFHRLQSDHFCCVQGMVKVSLYDDRPGSPTRHELMEVTFGERRQRLLVIPTLVMHGVTTVGGQPAAIMNFPDVKYDYKNPDEQRLPHNTPLKRKDGTIAPHTWFNLTEDEGHK